MNSRHFRVLSLVVLVGLSVCLTWHTLGATPKRGGNVNRRPGRRHLTSGRAVGAGV
jgi:hypothetical protein